MENETEEAGKLLVSVKLNLSLLYTNEKNYSKAVELSTEVLEKDTKNVKGYYRRANACFLMGNLDTAKADVLKVLKKDGLDPANKAVTKLYKKIVKAVKAEKAKKKKMY